ncbi:MAG: nitroreductase family protein [Anaerolineae bacterium]
MPKFIPLTFESLRAEDSLRRADEFYTLMSRRRTVRHFAADPLPPGLLETLIRTAGTAPSGAHQQPWRFVVVTDPALKRRLREAAEAEEREFYERRATAEWLADLAPLGTDWHKEFLEVAPALVVVFRVDFERRADGSVRKHYYVNESVGIAVGLFLAAAHTAGLATLTHTPSPMGFLNELLHRPTNERAFVVIPVGYPAPDAQVPDLARKPLAEIVQYNEG